MNIRSYSARAAFCPHKLSVRRRRRANGQRFSDYAGNYLKGGDLQGREWLVTIEQDRRGARRRDREKLVAHFVGRRKTLPLNQGHIAVLAAGFGDDPAIAAARSVILYPEATRTPPGSRQSASDQAATAAAPAHRSAAPQQAASAAIADAMDAGRRNPILRSATNEQTSLYSEAAPIRCAPSSTRRGGRKRKLYPVLRA